MIDVHRLRAEEPTPTPQRVRATMEAMIREGVTAERAGFHSIQVPDRHGRSECFFPGPEQLLTILARETERVAIGSFTFVATLIHPMKAAEQFSVVDNLSGGRLYTTVSRGFLPSFWQQFGVPQSNRLGRFKEALAIWQEAFKGQRFDFDGSYWQVQQGLLAPQPFQRGGWPIWGGGNAVPAAIERCAEYAECWTSDPLPMQKAIWDEQADLYRARAEALGKKPFVVMMRDGWVADSFEDAAKVFGEHYVRAARFYQRQGLLSHAPEFASEADITVRSVAPHLVLGTPSQCVEQLERLREEYHVDYVALCCRLSTGPSLEQTLEQIERLGSEVVGPIHAKYPPPDHPAIPAVCRW